MGIAGLIGFVAMMLGYALLLLGRKETVEGTGAVICVLGILLLAVTFAATGDTGFGMRVVIFFAVLIGGIFAMGYALSQQKR